jgi:hypothetical protein
MVREGCGFTSTDWPTVVRGELLSWCIRVRTFSGRDYAELQPTLKIWGDDSTALVLESRERQTV